MSRAPLSLGGLDDFQPRQKPVEAVKADIDSGAGWPSREPIAQSPAPVAAPREGQLNIRATEDVIERFKRLCKDDRRTYSDMLTILMDHFDGRSS